MKNLLFLLVGIIPFMASGQESEVPKPIENTFFQMFANAENLMWNEVDGDFEASFYIAEEYKLALFSTDGKWIETSTSINVEEASQDITNVIYKNHAGAIIDNVFHVEVPGKNFFYRIHIELEGAEYIIKMSQDYKILESRKVTSSLHDIDEEEEDYE